MSGSRGDGEGMEMERNGMDRMERVDRLLSALSISYLLSLILCRLFGIV